MAGLSQFLAHSHTGEVSPLSGSAGTLHIDVVVDFQEGQQERPLRGPEGWKLAGPEPAELEVGLQSTAGLSGG